MVFRDFQSRTFFFFSLRQLLILKKAAEKLRSWAICSLMGLEKRKEFPGSSKKKEHCKHTFHWAFHCNPTCMNKLETDWPSQKVKPNFKSSQSLTGWNWPRVSSCFPELKINFQAITAIYRDSSWCYSFSQSLAFN